MYFYPSSKMHIQAPIWFCTVYENMSNVSLFSWMPIKTQAHTLQQQHATTCFKKLSQDVHLKEIKRFVFTCVQNLDLSLDAKAHINFSAMFAGIVRRFGSTSSGLGRSVWSEVGVCAVGGFAMVEGVVVTVVPSSSLALDKVERLFEAETKLKKVQSKNKLLKEKKKIKERKT